MTKDHWRDPVDSTALVLIFNVSPTLAHLFHLAFLREIFHLAFLREMEKIATPT